MMETYSFVPGATPLLVSVPHAGTHVPDWLAARLTPEAAALPDTDWHVDRLYDFVRDTGAGLLIATHSRYVIDLNRDPSGAELYPGADNTEIVPMTTFARQSIYRAGQAPDAVEVAERIATYWHPYHQRLAEEVENVLARHGVAVLWDGHSIASQVPRFFSGRLPDLNLGSAGGTSADASLIALAAAELAAAPAFSRAIDGRFKGGYITRRFGAPARGVHALQLEIAQIAYMDEQLPYQWDKRRAAPLERLLRACLAAVLGWARARSRVSA
jgi:N-formylglutamate deformylase